jgi:hypothetical protein
VIGRAAAALLVLLTLAPPVVAAGARRPPSAPCSALKGSFAFHYGSRLSPEEIAWLRRFRIVVPGDVLPADQIRALTGEGARLFVYEWLTGLYADGDGGPRAQDSWAALVRRNRSQWLLNPDRPDTGPDGQGRAYYYDPSSRELALARARRLSETLRRASYAGVFFDLVGSPHVPAPLREEYRTRHPETPFDAALGESLRALRRTRPGTVVFTNQGYRIPEVYLPLTDYDLSESLMTSYEGGDIVDVLVEGEGAVAHRETYYRPWDELRRIVDAIDADVKRFNPAVKMLHLNYVNARLRPTGRTQAVGEVEQPVFRKDVDREAIYYGYVAAKLWGHESYSATAPVRTVQDEVYFADLGGPLGPSWEERDGLVRRYYDKGIVVLNPGPAARTASLRSPLLWSDASDLWDCYEGRAVGGLTVTVAPTVSPASGRIHPAGRVYLYLR